jgi:isopenicillin N synthase-like dioxygenase
MDSVPIIDVAPLRDGSAAGVATVAAAIGAAARDIGFFAIRNHGVPARTRAEMFAAAERFFALPLEQKRRISMERSAAYVGYAQLALEKLDPARPGDHKESFDMCRERAADDSELLAGKPFVARNQWPELTGFREPVLAYFDAVQTLALELHRAIAVDLGIDPHAFVRNFEQPLTAMRVLHYPPHPGTFDGVLYGAAPHTDYGSLTLLAQDETGGLEVRRRDGTWTAVDPLPDTFVCNIGDALMRWTNDAYVSTPHRVVNRSGRERYSAAFFCEPNGDAPIAAIPSCTSAANPPKYAPIAFADLLRSRVEPTYAREHVRRDAAASSGLRSA